MKYAQMSLYLFVVASLAVVVRANLVHNGDFVSATKGKPAEWSAVDSDDADEVQISCRYMQKRSSVSATSNYRLWLKGGAEDKTMLENCLSAYSIDRGHLGHDVGFWMLAGGEMSMTRCTAYGDRIAMKVEGKEGNAPKATHVALDHCALLPQEGGKDKSLYEGTDLKDTGSVTSGKVVAPSNTWRGGDDAFNLKSSLDVGYRYQAKK